MGINSNTRFLFQGAFNVMYAVKVTADISNAATGSGTFGTATVTVPGVALGDMVLVSSATATTSGAPIFGEVSAANTVRLVLLNNSAGAVDQASGTFYILVLRPDPGVFA